MKGVGATLGVAGVGTGIAIAGWPAVVALAIPVLAVTALIAWILNSRDRSTHLARIIAAARGSRRT